ncbi:hypothetical protein [Streptomyces sp. NPDC048269]|uniref:hypothetical protein n=1 Tax=Streptomyces sp. NPDC048269 TaxID=3155753 RepID=UPI0034382AD2
MTPPATPPREYPYAFHIALDGNGLNGLEGRAGVCVFRYDPATGRYKIDYYEVGHGLPQGVRLEIDAEHGQVLRHWTAPRETPAHINDRRLHPRLTGREQQALPRRPAGLAPDSGCACRSCGSTSTASRGGTTPDSASTTAR